MLIFFSRTIWKLDQLKLKLEHEPSTEIFFPSMFFFQQNLFTNDFQKHFFILKAPKLRFLTSLSILFLRIK